MASAKTTATKRRPASSGRHGSTIFHIHICLEGVRRWKNKDLQRLFTAEGEKVSADEIREWIDEKLSAGIRVIPMGDRCDNFDDVHGCLGHKKVIDNVKTN